MIRQLELGVLLVVCATTNAQAAALNGTAILGGAITNGNIKNAKVSSAGTNNCPKESIITDGVIKSGTVTGGTVSGGELPVEVQVDSGIAALNVNKAALSNAQIKGASVANVRCKGVTIPGPIPVDIDDVTIQDASIENAIVREETVLSSEDQNVSYAGDYFKFNVKVPGFVTKDGNRKAIAPAQSCFRVDNDPATKAKGDNRVSGKFVTTDDQLDRINFAKRVVLRHCRKIDELAGSGVLLDEEYTIDKANFSAYDRERFGWTYGVLLTPFKYYPGQKYFGSNSTIGGYLGYRIHDRQGISDTLAFTVGATSAAITNSAGVTANHSGATMAIALLSEIKNSFVVGLIVGRDYFSAESNYLYNGRTWIGINLGLKAN